MSGGGNLAIYFWDKEPPGRGFVLREERGRPDNHGSVGGRSRGKLSPVQFAAEQEQMTFPIN